MLDRLGRYAVRRRLQVLAVTLVGLAVAGLLGVGVVERLSTGGFVDPGSESARASALLERNFDAGEPNYVLLLTAPRSTDVDDPAVAAVGEQVTATLLAHDGVAQAASYWSLERPPTLRSTDDRSALILARLRGDEDAVKATAHELTAAVTEPQAGVTIAAGGSAQVYYEVGTTAEEDLVRAEMLALPLTFVVLVLVFGSFVAAALPVVIGVVAILGTLLTLALLTEVTEVSVFALNLTTALGLGLSIDYSLFVLTRYREELARGLAPTEAVLRTVATAGRTVAYSAVTVALSLAGLLVFPLYFLRSIAYAGIPVVLLAALAAVVVLPALLAVLGHRVDALSVRSLWRGLHAPKRLGIWGRVAGAVMRRPIPVATGLVVVLLALGAPFLGARFGLTDDRTLPPEAASHQVHEELRTRFDSREADALAAVSDREAAPAELSAYAATLSRIPGVARVDAANGSFAGGALVAPAGPATARLADGTGTWLSIVPSVEALSPAGERLVREIRDTPSPVPVLVGGSAARLVDTGDTITSLLPLALVVITASVGALLFLFTGGILVPVKALVLNVLSLTATFGVLVWGFQDGNLRWLVGDFTVTGTLDIAMPVLLFCVAFGLSMDYEVFLLSRIREEWERTGDNTEAVVSGLERTGRLITSAAVLVSVVFLSFATSGITTLKMLGIGLTVAVLVDATIVRAALVPAFMGLAGRANWWAPAPLRRLHDRIGLREEQVPSTVRSPVRDAPAQEQLQLAARV